MLAALPLPNQPARTCQPVETTVSVVTYALSTSITGRRSRGCRCGGLGGDANASASAARLTWRPLQAMVRRTSPRWICVGSGQSTKEVSEMTFIQTVSEGDATDAVASMYEIDRQVFGYLPNLTKAFSLRPEVYGAWRQLNGAIKANMDLRRYELATVAAARRLRSSYCTLAHGSVLLEKFLVADEVRAIVSDPHSAGLTAEDMAVMDLAEKIADDATAVTPEDIERLRSLGFTEAEIIDVVLAASARCFFSKVLDGLGVEPDAKYAELDPELRDALTVGRAIAGR
jgi:uncharacterized peroxidase-related enzyme